MTGDALLFFLNVIVYSEIKCIKHTRKPVNARSTQHQIHLSINHATSVLICTLVDIIFAILLNELEILDYNKMQSRPKICCVSSSQYHWLVCSLRL